MSTQNKKSREHLERIPTGNYEGYLWCSNEQKPKVYHPDEEFTDHLQADTIPFVVEGWLYDRADNKSYTIRYRDGKYIRTAYDLSATVQEPVEYIAHDLKGVETFWVTEYWAPEPDPRCAGMEVLRHAWTAFAGFTKPS